MNCGLKLTLVTSILHSDLPHLKVWGTPIPYLMDVLNTCVTSTLDGKIHVTNVMNICINIYVYYMQNAHRLSICVINGVGEM